MAYVQQDFAWNIHLDTPRHYLVHETYVIFDVGCCCGMAQAYKVGLVEYYSGMPTKMSLG